MKHGMLQNKLSIYANILFKYFICFFKAVSEESLLYIIEKWQKWGLKCDLSSFQSLMKTGMFEINKKYISANDLILKFIHLIVNKIQPIFSAFMKTIFIQNYKDLYLKHGDEQNIAVDHCILCRMKSKYDEQFDLKYKCCHHQQNTANGKSHAAQYPKCMNILDFLQCKMICSSDVELYQLFVLICNVFAGNILKVKNLFKQQNHSSFSYYDHHHYYPEQKSNDCNGGRIAGCGMIVVHVIFGIDEYSNYFNAELENAKMRRKKGILKERNGITEDSDDEYEYGCEFEIIVEIQLILKPYYAIQQKILIPELILGSNSDALRYNIPANEILAERMCHL